MDSVVNDQQELLRKQWTQDIARYSKQASDLMTDYADCKESLEELERYKASGETKLLSALELRVDRCDAIEPWRQSLLKRGKTMLRVVEEQKLGEGTRAILMRTMQRLEVLEPLTKRGVASRIGSLFKRKGGKKTRRVKAGGKRTRKH